MRHATLILTGVLVWVPHPAMSAQMSSSRSVNPDPRITQAEQLLADHRALESLRMFETVVDREPENYEALWKAARGAVVMGLLARGHTKTENRWHKIGEEYARRATVVAPDSIDGLYWLISAKGLRAVQTNPVEASRLGSEVYQLAHGLLAVDSLHAGAYNALGVLNYEVMKLTRIERFIATRILGNRPFRLMSWEDAETYLRRATELEPEFIRYHLDLGQMYFTRKQMELARRAFRTVLELPAVHAPDAIFQDVAARLLQEAR